MTPSLIDAWYRAFGSAPTSPRNVITIALDQDPALLGALQTVINDYHPHSLSRWLHKHENNPFVASDNQPYRFSRDKQGWRLIPTPVLVSA